MGCIEDCDLAIQMNPVYVKSYIRKAKAPQICNRFNEALQTVQIGLEQNPYHPELKELEYDLNEIT